ncbi:MAG: hypothetical protein ACLS9F_16845 [Clostridium paraputrificum]
MSIELLTDTDTSLFVLNANKDVVLYLKMPYKEKVYLKKVCRNTTIGIIGEGEVSFMFY